MYNILQQCLQQQSATAANISISLQQMSGSINESTLSSVHFTCIILLVNYGAFSEDHYYPTLQYRVTLHILISAGSSNIFILAVSLL